MREPKRYKRRRGSAGAPGRPVAAARSYQPA